jgi:predicted AlkP superfamily phosphohydrolase/phosphomutase
MEPISESSGGLQLAGAIVRRPHRPLALSYRALPCWLQPKLNSVRADAFPNQYIAYDKVLGTTLKHVDENTYAFIVSDHRIKPLREFAETNPHAHMDHEKTTPVIAKHDFADGDDVPGSFFAMGPGIKHGLRLMGFEASVYDIAPTILHISCRAAKADAWTRRDL